MQPVVRLPAHSSSRNKTNVGLFKFEFPARKLEVNIRKYYSAMVRNSSYDKPSLHLFCNEKSKENVCVELFSIFCSNFCD
jgi:hypothetical protein